MKKRLNVEIDAEDLKQLKAKCILEGKSLKEKILEWVKRFLRGELD